MIRLPKVSSKPLSNLRVWPRIAREAAVVCSIQALEPALIEWRAFKRFRVVSDNPDDFPKDEQKTN